MMNVNKGRIEADFRSINTHNATPGNGITRLTFSSEWVAARQYVIDEMEKIGAVVSPMPGANLRCRLPAINDSESPVMAGSHLDTVVHGGRFDGTAGVVAALETARIVRENTENLRRPFDVVVFPEEEGSRFGSVMLGSWVWVGKITMDELSNYYDSDGISYLKAMLDAGIEPGDGGEILRTGSFHAAFELHIEQSVVLEKNGLSLGIVEGIAGIRQYELTLRGTSNHAGGTPMEIRVDALAGAAEIAARVEQIAREEAGPHTVGTVGRIEAEPGLPNVIAGEAKLTVDIRDPDPEMLSVTAGRILAEAKQICSKRGLHYAAKSLSDTPPVTLSPKVVGRIRDEAAGMDVKTMPIVSGALHDSSVLATIGEVGMIFVPSIGGRSHCPEEDTDIDDIAVGTELLANTVIGLVS